MFDGFQGTTVASGEGRQAAAHRFDHREAKGLEQRRLDKGALAIGDVTIDFTDGPFVGLHGDPAHLPVQFVARHQFVDTFNLLALFQHRRFLRPRIRPPTNSKFACFA